MLDVGGAMGDTALYASYLYPKTHIDVFEPNPESYRLLQKNIKENDFKNVSSHNFAVGTKESYQFYISSQNVRSSFQKDKYSLKKITVKGTRLDSYIKGTIDLLKIDCEGGELDVLESISEASYKKINKMVLEYHNHLVKDQDKKITAYL
ncbi:MAG: FkbM family methyltransferase, partial [Candidatus Roizmanbacteria bacterium]